MSRGKLTEEVQIKANTFLHRDITLMDLRLYPYIDFCVKNFHKIDKNKINSDERKILTQLVEEGHITWGDGLIDVSRPFYDYLQDVLYVAYVADDVLD